MFQVLEQGLLSQCPVYQLPMVAGALVTSFDLSRSNQMLAFGDTCGACLSRACLISKDLVSCTQEYTCTHRQPQQVKGTKALYSECYLQISQCS